VGQLRDRMKTDLVIGGYSPSTQKIYLVYARKFAAHFMRSPAQMGADEIRQFLLHLVQVEDISRETLRQVRAALRFLYTVTLNRPTEIESVPVPRARKRLPVVLSGTEVGALLAAVRRPKYRLLLAAMYAAGLRISEACALSPGDIDSKRMAIRVRGKGDKERYTLLSKRLLRDLRDYWRLARPTNGRLFPGRTRAGHVSPATVRNIFREVVAASDINKTPTPHALRHSFATHLIESGVDISVVKALLGHTSLRATQVYTHTSIRQIARTRSPLDLLGTPDGEILG